MSTRHTLSANDISRVTVTSSAADMPSIVTELVKTNGVWGGVVGNIPAGTGRAFLAQAFGPADTLLYEGHSTGVTIGASEMSLITLTLHESAAEEPYTNEAPLIDSMVASPLVVAPGESVSLMASAHDPNQSDSLEYEWTAPSGIFSAPTQASTTWNAPATLGPVQLALTVIDSHGAATSVSFTVNVSAGQGDVILDVRFNNRPVVTNLSSSQSSLAVGEQTELSVSASDGDGDALRYQWSASCLGTWENPNMSTARFSPTALPAHSCNNCQVQVEVSDERGGHATATLALCVSPASPLSLPPIIVRSYQSALTATPSQLLVFEVVASDLTNSLLSFAWSSPVGALGQSEDSATRSRVTWTAPTCVPDGGTAPVTATVTNGVGLTATRTFTITGLASCALSGTWTATSSPSQARYWHTATTLSSGKVLVTGGGLWTGSLLETAEMYDPETGTWMATGAMSIPRVSHTATLLQSGKVLVTGGYSDTYQATAELYDPATGTWTSTGTMNHARGGHTATLLPSGKVLVVGGYSTDYAATAEVYDPATGTWTATNSMHDARSDHTATLLFSGKVLVTGGEPFHSSAELYDPNTGTWTPTGSMTQSREDHIATLLPSGKVLVLGGSTTSAATEVYDPDSGTWVTTGSMSVPRYQTAVTLLLSGKVLVAGGRSINGAHASAELYDPAVGTWELTSSMQTSRYSHSLTLLPTGKVLLSGGVIFSSAELYAP
ncbi:Kelch repeat-containing protein [Hyalangium minutum]|uniref:High-affinity leucine-specific transport system, periplasmic binding protein LivK n=1 Tax=Hyalangium minutum TaxID=394096 RepID=A0A085VSX4_9BACT|nr:kelch repeat-containing protein [Hyalangium minutum]KFE58537.1 High-affinity leucine-specific transport system, periplasmic binding protein LivK [Hyalangium minutum]